MAAFRFVYPTDGDMLTDAAGRLTEDGTFVIEAAVESDGPVTISGKPAEKGENGLWTAQIPLTGSACGYSLTAKDGEEAQTITVFRLSAAGGAYSSVPTPYINIFPVDRRDAVHYNRSGVPLIQEKNMKRGMDICPGTPLLRKTKWEPCRSISS